MGEPVSDTLQRHIAGILSAVVAPEMDGHVALPAARAPARPRVRAIAFYETDLAPHAGRLVGSVSTRDGWGRVLSSVPRFLGHEQPRVPGELGAYNVFCADVLGRQVVLARAHGLGAFCFRHRAASGSVSGSEFLERYLAASGLDFPFCLSWVGASDRDRTSSAPDLVALEFGARDFCKDAIGHLSDPRYVRIGDRPLIVVEHAECMGDPVDVIAHWRDTCREAGIAAPFVVAVNASSDPRPQGFDAALVLPRPDACVDSLPFLDIDADLIDPEFRGKAFDYAAHAIRQAARAPQDYPELRGVLPRWDDEPRWPGSGCVSKGASPEAYRQWLGAAVVHAESHPVAGESIVFVHAWNGWMDGAVLEPDLHRGYALLHATRSALVAQPRHPRLALMVHDANAHGAQYLALSLLAEFKRMGVDVETLLLGDGWLEPRFEALAPLHRLYTMDATEQTALAADLRTRGFEAVIANTTVCGRAIGSFRDAGMRVVALIHELPGLIANYGLQDALTRLADASDHVVVSSHPVREGVLSILGQAANVESKLVLQPQGLYTRNRYRGAIDGTDARVRLRDRMGLPHHVAIVLAVGFADMRKGVDLLAQAAIRACAHRDDLYFIWVGQRDSEVCAGVDAVLENAGIVDHFRFVGPDFDTDDYFAGADVYALCSREDPLPTVALESLAVGTPVIAFSGTGGAADLIDGRAGYAVRAFDVDAYAAALLHVINNPTLRMRLGAVGRDIVDRDFAFRKYAIDLLAMCGDDTPRVSAIVPNYNYARYLPERIDSISAQSFPLAEVVVLDDASSDNSLDILRMLRLYSHPEPLVVRGDANSGSVFHQWLAGVRRTEGEFVWIAEADDAADPALIQTLMRAMSADTRIVMAYAQSCRIDATGAILAPDYLGYTDDISVDRWRSPYTVSGAEEVGRALAVKNTVPNVSAALFRRDALLHVLERNIDELASYRIAGDWVVYLRLLKFGYIHYVPDVLNRHRYHAKSVTVTTDLERHYQEVAAVQALARRLYRVGDATVALAEDYAARLRSHFGLAEPCR